MNKQGFPPFTVYCLLFTVCFFSVCCLFACGKKGPLTLKSYEKPEAPSELKAIHREGSIILSWTYSKKEYLKEFDVFRTSGEDRDFEKIAVVLKDEDSYSDEDFKTGLSYKYKIVARSIRNILSDDSNIIIVKLAPVPSAPRNISAKAGNDAVQISWESAGEGILYNIYKSAKKGSYGLNPLNKEPLKTASYADSIELSGPVYYTVRGALNNEIRDEGPASGEIEINPANFIPSSPEGLEIFAAEDKVVISWKENPETWITKYRVFRKTTESEGFKLIGEVQTPAFTDREKTGTRHTYRVTAVGPSKESEPSKIVEAIF